MATAIMKKKSVRKLRRTAHETFSVDIPTSDKVFFRHFADKMGWHINNGYTAMSVADEHQIEELKVAILEAKTMGEDIRKNGIKGYKTLDE